MKNNNYNIDYITLPNGEAAKSMNEFNRVISAMIDMHCDRTTNIIALGGGVVGDLSLLASPTSTEEHSLVNGVNFIQVKRND